MMTLLFCPPSGLRLFVSPYYIILPLLSSILFHSIMPPFPALFAEIVDAQCGLCLWAARKTARWCGKER